MGMEADKGFYRFAVKEGRGSTTIDGEGQASASSDRAIFPIYQLAVEMADRVSQRRQAANSFGLALNSALVSAEGAVLAIKHAHPMWWPLLLAAAGVWESVIWGWMIRSYRQLNGAKYLVIHELEQMLSAAPYTREWDILGRGRSRLSYWPISHVESLAPWGFVVIYLASSLAMILGALK